MKCKIAAVQIATEIGEVQKNVAKAVMYTKQAINEGAKIICMPEMFNTGYFSHTSHADTKYFDLAEPVTGYTVMQFQKLAKEHDVVILVPFVELCDPGVLHNSVCVIDAGGDIMGTYKKIHMPWSHTGWEKFYFRPGYEIPIFETKYARLGTILCYDRDFPELARTIGLKGAQILFIPNGAGTALKETWRSLVMTRAYENQMFVMGCCLTGGTDKEHHEFMGSSIFCNPMGKIVQVMEREEGVLMGEFDPALIEQSRRSRFMYRDRRPEMYTQIVEFK